MSTTWVFFFKMLENKLISCGKMLGDDISYLLLFCMLKKCFFQLGIVVESCGVFL